MKRSLQEVAELVVFGLIALLVGTGLLWLVGWVLSLGGLLLKSLAGLLWLLLRYIVPIAIVAGLVYFLVKAAQDRQPKVAAAGAGAGTGASGTGSAAVPAVAADSGDTKLMPGEQASVAEVTEVAEDSVAESAGTAVAEAKAATEPSVEEAESLSDEAVSGDDDDLGT